ncbi:MAG: hypothetical protein P8L49_14015 [Opitutaceae bacterium]|nr:hypothetical protein [Opitutaceae bacterium]
MSAKTTYPTILMPSSTPHASDKRFNPSAKTHSLNLGKDGHG